MIYGEVVQKWRLAKGATLRKWPHAQGTGPCSASPCNRRIPENLRDAHVVLSIACSVTH